MRVFIDSDILIWHLRGEKKATNLLMRLRKQPDCELWTGAMQRAEIQFFMRKHEEEKTLLFLSLFHTAPVDAELVDLASVIYRRWSPSHGMDVNDALLAASAMKYNGQIICLNKKHYPMQDIVVKKGW